jgi:hypothetical protein
LQTIWGRSQHAGQIGSCLRKWITLRPKQTT